MMREEFLGEIDKQLTQAGYADRSSFIRDAVYEKLRRLGYVLPPSIKTAPNRAGKGGPRKKLK
jgi:hypothetical protein